MLKIKKSYKHIKTEVDSQGAHGGKEIYGDASEILLEILFEVFDVTQYTQKSGKNLKFDKHVRIILKSMDQ